MAPETTAKTSPFSKPVDELIRSRYSCRTYRREPLSDELRSALANFAARTSHGPLGHKARFELVAASAEDPQRLRSLGTYGFIKDASAYLVGAMGRNQFCEEDFGYLLEKLILYATDLGLGTCWLGGTFTKSSFAKKIAAQPDEVVPAVSAVGYIADKPRRIETWLKARRGTKVRIPWSQLFFDQVFGKPLPEEGLNGYHTPLEMVRLAPSASNRQPWRIIRDAKNWHFYVQRTPGYRDKRLTRWTTVADLQRMDLGIAMCHFELTAVETGLGGKWDLNQPPIKVPDEHTQYTATWISD